MADTTSFDYDDEGQLEDMDGTPFSFDYEHRLKSIGGTACRYSYDGTGNRLKAVRSGVTTYYIYDSFGNLLAEADPNLQITRYYIYGQGLLAVVTSSDEIYCYHFNSTGSTIAITDENQDIVNSYAYTPFGIILAEQENVSQPFKYVGQHGVMTEPNGFYYMRARYYDPEVGRFISEDTVGFNGGDVNLYVYAGNNPIMWVDPFGLCNLPLAPPGVDIDYNIAKARIIGSGGLIWYYDTVKPGGNWDYKQLDIKYEDFGNFNFGATGAAMGFSEQMLLRGAGWAHQRANNPSELNIRWLGPAPYGDDPRDQAQIKAGINYYNNCFGR